MSVPGTSGDTESARSAIVGNLPITVGVVALIAWYFATNGIYVTEAGAAARLNPINHVMNMFLHAGWGHFEGNMQLWLPFGVVLTWLTSNRHVFGVAVVSHVLTSMVGLAIHRFGIGMSIAVFAVIAATLVRSTGYAFQNASMESLQTALAGLLVPVLGGLFLIVLVAGNTRVGHFAHFLGFLFGGAIEAMFVFTGHETDENERRTVPRRIGRR